MLGLAAQLALPPATAAGTFLGAPCRSGPAGLSCCCGPRPATQPLASLSPGCCARETGLERRGGDPSEDGYSGSCDCKAAPTLPAPTEAAVLTDQAALADGFAHLLALGAKRPALDSGDRARAGAEAPPGPALGTLGASRASRVRGDALAAAAASGPARVLLLLGTLRHLALLAVARN